MRHAAPVLLLAAALAGCSGPSIAPFSAHAYEQAVSLKVETLTLMAEATEPFEAHEAEVEALRTELEKAYEFAAGRPRNDLTARQWLILQSPDRALLGRFFREWEERGTLPPFLIEEMRGLVRDAFDTIIGLESGKLRPDDVEP